MTERRYPDKLEIVPLTKPPNATIRVPGTEHALDILAYPAPFVPAFSAQAAKHDLSLAALLGLARQESAFDPRIDSGAGARGLMQIMPAVGKRLAQLVPGQQLVVIEGAGHVPMWDRPHTFNRVVVEFLQR